MDLLKPSYATGYAKNASQSAHPNLWDGLVGAWMPSMGDCGYDLNDLSGRGNHAELDGRSSPAPLKIIDGSRQIVLDGSADYFRVNNVKDFSPAELTYCYWVTQPTLGVTSCPGGVWRSGRRSWLSQHQNNYPQFFHSNDGSNSSGLTSSVSLINNKLTFVAMRYGGGSKQIWQNGVRTALATGVSVSGDLFDSQTEFCIGDFLFVDSSTPFGRNWQGGISAQMVYNRALSPQEIKQLYVDSLAPFRTKKRTVVRVPAAIPAATVVGSIKKPTTIIKPSYQAGYALNASESENPQLWDGLVGAWMPSLGVTGETLRDVSGNGNHGTLNGMDAASDWVATSKGLALDFDGSDDYVNFGNIFNDVFAGADKKFSIMSWVNYNTLDLNGNHIVNKNGDSSNNENQRQFSFQVRNPNNAYGSYELEFFTFFSLFSQNYRGYRTVGADIQTGRFYHFCVSYDGNINGPDRYGLFVDGVKYSVTPTFSGGAWGDIQSGTARLAIGAQIGSSSSSPTGVSDASIANLSIYNRALSPTEIKQLYVDSLAPFRKKQRVSVAVPAATPTPSATYHPLRSLAHPLEQ